jgi:hypothetical protein
MFSVVVLNTIVGNAQIPTRTPDWVNIRDPKFGAIGNGSHDDTAAIQAAIDYAFAHNRPAVYCPAGTYKTSSPIYLDPPGNLRTNPTNPPLFSFTMAFIGDPAGGGQAHLNGCLIEPNFNNDIAFIVGTGQSMRVSDIAVIGPGNGYRGALNSAGVGIGIGSGGGGAATTLIQNTYVSNFFALYKTDAIGSGALSEGNRFKGVGGTNGYFGIFLAGTQAYNDQIIEPVFGEVQDAIDSSYSKQVNVLGGNLSATTGASNTFAISGTSLFFAGCQSWCFTTTIASPDSYVGTPVYNAYMVVTPDFGVIPLTLTNWNPSTSVATFGLYNPWVRANYGATSTWISGDPGVQYEIQAANTLYAAEQDTVAKGMGIDLYGTHIENPNTCTALFVANAAWGGQISNAIVDPYFNYDPSLGIGTTAQKYCQQSFPFISVGVGGATLKLQGGNYNNATNPLLIEAAPSAQIEGSQLTTPKFNLRISDQPGTSYGQIAANNQFPTMARGMGNWDNDYFLPAAATVGSALQILQTSSELTTDYCGYEPCVGSAPNLSPTLYALVSGPLGRLGSYPPIACRTVFKSVDWDTGVVTPPSTVGGGIFLRSASCPGYSWGQSLTNSTIGGTVTWSYMGQSDDLYLDATSLSWMFPGLGISINNGSGSQPYIVTEVYPLFGYVTVIWAGSNSGGGLQGSQGQIYSCASSCTIGQAPFEWTAY